MKINQLLSINSKLEKMKVNYLFDPKTLGKIKGGKSESADDIIIVDEPAF